MMADTMVDSNVLLDVLTEDSAWFDWSASSLDRCAEESILVINPMIYAEISIHFSTMEDLDLALLGTLMERRPIPWQAAFLAGKCFAQYRQRGGVRRSPLPDFFIGAHAAVEGMSLLTRDADRYRTYFPKLNLIAPE
jgi:predicted nucleic acid-binding protein